MCVCALPRPNPTRQIRGGVFGGASITRFASNCLHRRKGHRDRERESHKDAAERYREYRERASMSKKDTRPASEGVCNCHTRGIVVAAALWLCVLWCQCCCLLTDVCGTALYLRQGLRSFSQIELSRPRDTCTAIGVSVCVYLLSLQRLLLRRLSSLSLSRRYSRCTHTPISPAIRFDLQLFPTWVLLGINPTCTHRVRE